MVEIRHYLTRAGRDPYQAWLDRLKDRQSRVAIQRRIDRIAADHLGTTSLAGTVSGNCESMSVPATGFTTRATPVRSFYCCAAATSVPRPPISMRR
jgi:hypothetical protein